MTLRLWAGVLAAVALAPAAEKKPAAGTASNDAVEISATAFIDKSEVRQAIGSDLEDGFRVLEVRITPKEGKLTVHRDDFLLRSERDGQRCGPFAPSQIAGSAVLRVGSGGGGGGIMVGESGPVWGGMPGTMGRPRRLGDQGAAVGNADTTTSATAQTAEQQSSNPLLDALKKKVLAEKEISEPVSGLLYFHIEGKLKPKDLVLDYKGPAGTLSLRFR